jgi:hypothetical protein
MALSKYENHKKWLEKPGNRDKWNEYQRKWRRKNRDKTNTYQRKWVRKNTEKVALNNMKSLMRRFPDAAQKILEVNFSTSTNKQSEQSLCTTCRLRASGCGLVYKDGCDSYVIGGIA